eukprot:jgi/Chrzof1/12550/UNPLg00501.t1
MPTVLCRHVKHTADRPAIDISCLYSSSHSGNKVQATQQHLQVKTPPIHQAPSPAVNYTQVARSQCLYSPVYGCTDASMNLSHFASSSKTHIKVYVDLDMQSLFSCNLGALDAVAPEYLSSMAEELKHPVGPGTCNEAGHVAADDTCGANSTCARPNVPVKFSNAAVDAKCTIGAVCLHAVPA